ncbi:hypothetical protein HYQ46_011855 [Verticillium longisporum]|nr:hypothetical protein HYQ46_011855 [Verticillium longisporum]
MLVSVEAGPEKEREVETRWTVVERGSVEGRKTATEVAVRRCCPNPRRHVFEDTRGRRSTMYEEGTAIQYGRG